MSEENEVQDEETTEEGGALTEENVYVGTDPIYQNSAYHVTAPAPIDDEKQAAIDAEAALVVDPNKSDWTSFRSSHAKMGTSAGWSEAASAPVDGDGEEEEVEEVSLEDETLTALRTRASELEIPGRTNMDRDQLIAAISEAEAE
jgi:hypothetical protein